MTRPWKKLPFLAILLRISFLILSSLFLLCSFPVPCCYITVSSSLVKDGTVDTSGVSASVPKPRWLTELFQLNDASVEWFIYSSNSSLLGSYFLSGLILHMINFQFLNHNTNCVLYFYKSMLIHRL